MVDIATDLICQEALTLAAGSGAGASGGDAAVQRLVSLADGDRSALEGARNAFATHLHQRSDDYAATGALRLLNRSLSAFGWVDPYDWRGRLGNRLAKP